MTTLIENKLYCVEVPSDATEFNIDGKELYYKSNFEGFGEVGRLRNIPDLSDDFKIIGEVSKDEISFDAEPYVEKTDSPYWYSRGFSFIDYTNDSNCFTTSEESFLRLLQSKGVYFENPIKEPESRGVSEHYILGPTDEEALAYDEWQESENKLIKGKLIILDKL